MNKKIVIASLFVCTLLVCSNVLAFDDTKKSSTSVSDENINFVGESGKSNYSKIQDEIEFPVENGPYKLFLAGTWMGYLQPIIFNKDGFYKIGPFCYCKSNFSITYDFFQDSCNLLIINGKIQKINYSGLITTITVYGFKGYHPGAILFVIKVYFYDILCGDYFYFFWRLRSFGTCDAIDFK